MSTKQANVVYLKIQLPKDYHVKAASQNNSLNLRLGLLITLTRSVYEILYFTKEAYAIFSNVDFFQLQLTFKSN